MENIIMQNLTHFYSLAQTSQQSPNSLIITKLSITPPLRGSQNRRSLFWWGGEAATVTKVYRYSR
ncbi:MAG: hypothetical protein ACR2PJ_03520, partial [Pseudomonadales bacterium]